MKRILLIFCFAYFSYGSSYSQVQPIMDKVLQLKGALKNDSAGLIIVDSLLSNLKFYRDFEKNESVLNGKAKFGLLGNESSLNNISTINAGVEIDNGLYPYEFDLSANFQTNINNGKLVENISNVDISFDYHPLTNNGLWLESFIFMSRFNNSFLGIDQRYETGGGLVFNLFSKEDLTDSGTNNEARLVNIPTCEINGKNLIVCYADRCTPINNEYKITESEIEELDKVRTKYRNHNIKKYSKLRVALLLGVYYENEKAKAENKINFNGVDTLFSIPFDATYKLRWEIRPTIVYKPSDIFTLKLYPYFKLPLFNKLEKVIYNDSVFDERYDAFFDIKASIGASINKNLKFEIVYRYFKDMAPKRAYIVNDSNIPELVVGQTQNSFYNINFSFEF